MTILIQIPREVPHPDNNTPIDFSNPFDIIVYIVIPVLLLFLYFFLRKKRRKGANKEENNE